MSSLTNVPGRVIIEVDLQKKNFHTFSSGVTIRRERQYDNFNKRETEPVNAIVISAENIPSGVEILIHPNATQDTYQIHNYRQLSGKDEGSDIRYFSVPEDQCFIWRDGDTWKPIFPYETALRVFQPYKGILHGIEPKLITDTLYVTSGEFSGKVVKTLKASDYCIVFQDVNGQENKIIRFRPNGCEKTKKEPEAIAIMDELAEQVENGDLFVGIEISDAKSIQLTAYAD